MKPKEMKKIKKGNGKMPNNNKSKTKPVPKVTSAKRKTGKKNASESKQKTGKKNGSESKKKTCKKNGSDSKKRIGNKNGSESKKNTGKKISSIKKHPERFPKNIKHNLHDIKGKMPAEMLHQEKFRTGTYIVFRGEQVFLPLK